jgi:pimeloyl-[acyl-carrier protein] methyl ester esterase
MDGTAELFREFSAALPKTVCTKAPIYPRDRFCTFAELVQLVHFVSPQIEPFVLLAESYSTPVAIEFAATRPANLCGLVLCAGFASSPANSLLRPVLSSLAPILLRRGMPEFAVRRWLTGADAPGSLVAKVQMAIGSVEPKVLVDRLRAILACDVRAELRRVAVPILYLQAKDDRIVGAECLVEMQKVRPDIRVEIMEGPHLLLQRSPRRAAEVVTAFVRQFP